MGRQLKKITRKRRFFVNYFVVSLILMILVCLIIMFFRHGLYNMANNMMGITTKQFDFCVINFMTMWKLLIIQFTLAPAIAYLWLEKHEEYKNETDEYENRRM